MLWALPGTFPEKLHTAAQAGYRHVELVNEWLPWDAAAWTTNLRLLRDLNLQVDAIAGIQSGFATPGGTDAFLAELQALAPIAQRLGARQVILLSGPVVPRATEIRQRDAAIATLVRAAPLLASAGLTGVLEPIDRLEQPTVWMDTVDQALALVQAVASPHLRVLYDLYHEQRGHGDLLRKLQQHPALIGLVHIADNPGRHRPGTGEIDFPAIYRTLRQVDYTGLVAMEFYPQTDAASELRTAREDLDRILG